MRHTRYHWIAVALILIALMLALNEAHGQSTGAAAVFEGRPAMAGAQAGLGAQAGPPQGGIGVQGSDLSPPRDQSIKPKKSQEVTPPKDSTKPGSAREVAKPKDTGVARDERSAVKKGTRAAKRTVKRSRTGVGEIDTSGKPGG
jgi:hypothetical protein